MGLILVAISLVACSDDETLPPSGDGLSASSVTEKSLFVDQFGARAQTCPVQKEDASSIDVSVASELATGDVVAVMSVGSENCYRVGSTVADMETSLELQVVKVEVVSWDSMQVEHADAVGLSLQDLQEQAWQDIVSLVDEPKPSQQVSFTYVVKKEPLLAIDPLSIPGEM